eukprot:3141191-Rhodomonas_salina.1
MFVVCKREKRKLPTGTAHRRQQGGVQYEGAEELEGQDGAVGKGVQRRADMDEHGGARVVVAVLRVVSHVQTALPAHTLPPTSGLL